MAILVMKFTVFLVLVKVAWDGTNLEVDGLAGLHRRSPLLAMALMVALFSLAGLPPTVGFTGKFLVFTAAMEQGHFALVVIAMINVVISLYYYLLMLRAAYLLEPEEQSSPLSLSLSTKLLAGALVVVMVAAGVFPRYLMDLARSAAQGLM
jgi:NADH-quinone oxidoreductase subunit N